MSRYPSPRESKARVQKTLRRWLDADKFKWSDGALRFYAGERRRVIRFDETLVLTDAEAYARLASYVRGLEAGDGVNAILVRNESDEMPRLERDAGAGRKRRRNARTEPVTKDAPAVALGRFARPLPPASGEDPPQPPSD